MMNFWDKWYPNLDKFTFGQYRNKKFEDVSVLEDWVKDCIINGEKPFVSVQPDSSLYRLFFDFDSKLENKNDAWADCVRLAYAVKREGAEPLIFDTGNRGYHLYVYIWIAPIAYHESQKELSKEIYKQMILTLLDCEWSDIKTNWKTIDPVVLQLSALSRVPLTVHEDTNKTGFALDLNREPMSDINVEFFRERHLPSDFIHDAIIKARWVFQNSKSEDFAPINGWKIRPCIEHGLRGHPSHDVRLAYVLDAHYSGMGFDEIMDRFRVLEDFEESQTRYQIEYTMKKIEGGLRPFRESTLRSRGICDNSCGWMIKILRPRNE